jgi:hypothetical protein
VVARAAAEVAGERLANLILARVGILRQQVGAGHDHARRAVAALEAVVLPEALLHRVQIGFGADALDRRHLGAVGLCRQHGARLDRVAVEVDGASPAVGGVAADVGAREPQVVTQIVHEQEARLHLSGLRLSVHGQRDPDRGCHTTVLLPLGRLAAA